MTPSKGVNVQRLTERHMQQMIVQAAKLRGWLVYFTWNSRHSPEGFPDLICLKDKTILVYELKTEKGRIRPMQREWIEAFDGAMVRTSRIIRPDDLDDVLNDLMTAYQESAA